MFSGSLSFRKCVACGALLLFAVSGSGCGRFSRIRQCRKLISQVNPALDDVVTLTHGNTGNALSAGSAGYIAAAGRYDRLSKELGPMEFSSEQMAKFVAEYAGVLTSTAQTLRTLATALDANNTGEAERITHELERLNIREHTAVAKIDAWCQPD